MPDRGPLDEYWEKRDFSQTSEPVGTDEPEARGKPIFVVQKHSAGTLHYDFRLEVGGVLKSWAVPKGPSLNPRDKRLAVATEDHPIGYARFEGVIPEGQYGAGPVIVWDTGTFRNITEKGGRPVPAEQAIADGHISIRLNGRKLKGGFTLRRFRTDDEEAWLLIKMADEHADPSRVPVRDEPRSVLSGRTIEDLLRK